MQVSARSGETLRHSPVRLPFGLGDGGGTRCYNPAMYPRWFIVLANVIIFGLIVGLGVFVKALGWQFALGGLVGGFAVLAYIRMDTGRWP